jgi:hypothetical protein
MLGRHGPLDRLGLLGLLVSLALLSGACASAQRPTMPPPGTICDPLEPRSPTCDYALAVSLGLQAREHPASARDQLAQMVVLLRRTALADPTLDQAGPHRLLALVLLRAPGWPRGPGDPEEGLVVARRAVALAPGYAPNLLALAEALAINEQPGPAREAATRALPLAEAAVADGVTDAAEWLREARERSTSE